MIYFLPLRSSKLSKTDTPVPEDVIASCVGVIAFFNTNVIVVFELLYLATPIPKSVFVGSVGVPDPELKLEI